MGTIRKLVLALVMLSGTIALAALTGTFHEFTILIDKETYDYSLERFIGSSPLTSKSFEKAYNDGKFTGYESFLIYLKARSPELFERPVLLHTTGSLQFASFERPRTILFGSGSIISFAEEQRPRVKRVEMMEFDPSTSKFVTAEITFENKGVGPVKFTSNPRVCIACHGKDTKPIWLPYDSWPKTYGAFNSGMVSPSEKAAFARFYNQSRGLGVYKHLVLGEDPSRQTFKGNLILTQYLNNLAYVRGMRLLKQKKSLYPFRYALLGAFNRCMDDGPGGRLSPAIPVEEFIPQNIRDEMPLDKSFFEADTAKSRANMTAYIKGFYERLFPGEVFRAPQGERLLWENKMLANVRFLSENFGLPWRSVALGHGVNSFSMTIPGNMAGALTSMMIIFDQSLFKELKPKFYINPENLTWAKFDCKELKEASLETLEQIRPEDLDFNWTSWRTEDVSVALAPISRCIKCHVTHESDGNQAPDIPFDDMSGLREWLRNGDNSELLVELIQTGWMPEKSHIDEEHKQAIYDMVGALKDLDAVVDH